MKMKRKKLIKKRLMRENKGTRKYLLWLLYIYIIIYIYLFFEICN